MKASRCTSTDSTMLALSWKRPRKGRGHAKNIIINKLNTESLSKLGITGSVYKHPEYVENSTEAKSFLAGSEEFKVLEIEVHMKKWIKIMINVVSSDQIYCNNE